MNQISNPPNNYDFGLSFDYAVWTAKTNITLTNVPWNNDYRDVVSFASTNALNNYIDKSATQNVSIANATYAKANEPISIEVPFNVANKFNYVRVYNPAQPAKGDDVAKYFYYFIIDVRYIAPNTTQIVVQLDVFQTYIRQVQFGRCYIERGHVGIANELNFQNYGRDYLTVPEGLDVGSNYLVVDKTTRPIMSMTDRGNNGGTTAYIGHSILVCSTIDLEADPGTVANPKMRSAKGGAAMGLVSGASFYLFKSARDFQMFMTKYSEFPWVTQGITSITIIPDYRRYWTDAHLGARLPFGGYKAPSVTTGDHRSNLGSTPFRKRSAITNYIPPRYRHLNKFRVFPYMAIRIASNAGQQVILQPEFWNSDYGAFREMASLLPPNARIGIVPLNYNTTRTDSTNSPAGDGMDRQVSVSGLPTLPIVNNGAILYMAQNAHSIAYGHQSADWSQQKALRGNEVSYDQANMGIAASGEASRIAMGADASSTAIANQYAQNSQWLNAVGGVASGAGMGAFAGPMGAVAGGVGGAASGVMGLLNTGMQVDTANQQLANRLSAAGAQQANSTSLASGIRDTNKGLADWAARGDYESAIAGLNAKTQDAQLTAPSLAGQQGGETYNLLNDVMEFRFEILMPDQASIQAIGEYWLRYGYAVHRFSFIPPSLMAMSKFTYWKMKETYIRAAAMPETFKQSLRGIFEKGVTVWGNPDDIGFIDPADNVPIDGIVIDGYVPPAAEPEPEPEPPTVKKRKKKMLVYSAVDDNPATPGNVWALAGSSPGSDANFIETRDAARALAFQEACGVDSPVGLTIAEFNSYRDLYRAPISTQEIPPAPEV